MNFFDLVKKRRSVRKFTNDKVPDKVINKCLEAAILAPNSSNLQPWEFYWIKNKNKKENIKKACFSQNAATTAQEIIVAVSRIDTWKRNKDLIIEDYKKKNNYKPIINRYYNKLIPILYYHDIFGISNIVKKIFSIFYNLLGIFKPVLRSPIYKHELFEVVTKSTALACQNLMLGLVAEGFDSCPMEGFDEKKVKKILNLNRNSHVVMILGIGKAAKDGVYGERYRVEKNLVIKKV
mgnify:FL=1|tara:strand:+ start:11735 stop:12442 length:708 start_codon:yes stop_codon:yes gene_type:complete